MASREARVSCSFAWREGCSDRRHEAPAGRTARHSPRSQPPAAPRRRPRPATAAPTPGPTPAPTRAATSSRTPTQAAPAPVRRPAVHRPSAGAPALRTGPTRAPTPGLSGCMPPHDACLVDSDMRCDGRLRLRVAALHGAISPSRAARASRPTTASTRTARAASARATPRARASAATAPRRHRTAARPTPTARTADRPCNASGRRTAGRASRRWGARGDAGPGGLDRLTTAAPRTVG